MAVTNVRVTDSRNNTRRVFEVPEGSTVAAVLTAAGVPFSESGYAITYRAAGTSTITARLPSMAGNRHEPTRSPASAR